MERTGALAVAAVLGLTLAGCGEFPLKESDVEATLPTKAAQIAIGETDRAEVRRVFGAPLAASEYWRFDLFRLSEKDVTLHWYLFPMAVSSQDVNGYMVVEYDDRGTVTAYQYGLERESSFLRYDVGEEADLVAQDVQLVADEDTVFLAVSAERRDSYLTEHDALPGCRVVIGCASSEWCFVRVKIDGDRQVDLPLALGFRPTALVAQELAAGEHSITASPALNRVSFAGATTFTCPAGETRFMALELSPDDTKGVTVFRRHLFATFAVSVEVPEVLAAQRFMIWRDGEWLVPQEPGR